MKSNPCNTIETTVVVEGNQQLFDVMIDELVVACGKVDIDSVSDIIASQPFDESRLVEFGRNLDNIRNVWESFILMTRAKAFTIVPYVVPKSSTDN